MRAPSAGRGLSAKFTLEGPIRRTREGGGGEWEPIKILLEGDGNSNKMNTTTKHVSDSTTQVGQDHVATGVLLILGTNTQPSEPKLTNTHSGKQSNLMYVPHRSDRSLPSVRLMAPVRPVDSAGLAGGEQQMLNKVPGSLSDSSRPWNKNNHQNTTCQQGNPSKNLVKQLQTSQELTSRTT
jgi:hypothetical protein